MSISAFNDLFLGNIISGLIALITEVGTMIVPILDIVNINNRKLKGNTKIAFESYQYFLYQLLLEY